MDQAVQVLMTTNAFHRVKEQLGDIDPAIEPILWHADGPASNVAGKDLPPEYVSPRVGWLSFDLMGRRLASTFVESLLQYDSIEWVQTANTGLDHAWYTDLLERPMRVCNSNAQSLGIAEFVMTEVLRVVHDSDERRRAQAEKRWNFIAFRELHEMSWLLVGFGAINQYVAQRARAFGCEIKAIRKSAQSHTLADYVGAPHDLHTLLPQADIVVMACPLTAETRELADARFFSRMQDDAIFVNVARGEVVDEAALLAALDAGKPAFAILDVFAEEPLPESSPFWTHPRVHMTPHTAGAGMGLVKRGDAMFLRNLQAFLAGRRLENEVTVEMARAQARQAAR